MLVGVDGVGVDGVGCGVSGVGFGECVVDDWRWKGLGG